MQSSSLKTKTNQFFVRIPLCSRVYIQLILNLIVKRHFNLRKLNFVKLSDLIFIGNRDRTFAHGADQLAPKIRKGEVARRLYFMSICAVLVIESNGNSCQLMK